MATRLQSEVTNLRGDDYFIYIDDSDFVGTATTVQAGAGAFEINWPGKSSDPFHPIIGSKASVYLLIEDSTETAISDFNDDLISAAEERFTIKITKNGSLWWCGYILADLSAIDDIGTPRPYRISAVDGIGRLKSYDFDETGNFNFMDIIVSCLVRGSLASTYYTAGDIFLRTVVNWNASGHATPTANKCPLHYSRISADIFKSVKAGTVEVEYASCYKVLEEVCRAWGARLYYSEGAWRFEQMREKAQDLLYERRFDITSAFVSGTSTAAYDVNVQQNAINNRLAGGSYSFIAPTSIVRVEYEHNTYKNFFPSDQYTFYYNGSANTQIISDVGLDSDSVIRVNGTAYIKIRLSEAHTVPWRYILRLQLIVGTDSYDSATYAVSAGGNGTYTVHRYNPQWRDSAFEYYEISTPFVTGVNNVFNINFQFDTPIPPPDGDTIQFGFSEYGAVDKDGTFQDLDLITDVFDWRIYDLNFQIHNSNDPDSLIEKVRVYELENTETGNSNKIEIKTLFGHAVRSWTIPKIQVSSDLSTWADATESWDYNTETKNYEFGALLAAEIMTARKVAGEIYNGSIKANNIGFHRRLVLSDNTTWLWSGATYYCQEDVWRGDLFRAGINAFNYVVIKKDKKTDPGNTGGTGPSAELAKPPGVWLPDWGIPGLSGPVDMAMTALAINYVGTTVAAGGAITSIPLEYAVAPNSILENDDIFIVDPSSGLIIGATVDVTANGGDTSLTIESISSDVDIPSGAYILYGPLNKFTQEGGGNSGALPSGTDTQTLRHNGSGWVASSIIRNDGTQAAVGAAPSSSYMLLVKQTGLSTSTNGIAVERAGSTNIAAIYHNGSATFESVGGNNLQLKTASGSIITITPGGGGGQIGQVTITPGANVTSVSGNAAMLRITGTYAATGSGGDFSGINLQYAVNQSGSADQVTRGLLINPTLTAVAVDFRGVVYQPSSYKFLYQASGTSVVSHLIGNLGIGTGTTSPGAKIDIVGNGTTSSTYGLKVSNSTPTEILVVRDDQRVGVRTSSPATPLHVVGTGTTSGSTSFLVEDSSGGDNLKVRDDGVVIARALSATNEAPSIAYGTGAGTGPTTDALDGGNNGFYIIFTTGTGPATNAQVFTATLTKTFPNGVIATISPYGATATGIVQNFFVSGFGGNLAQISYQGTLTASTQYGLMINISGY